MRHFRSFREFWPFYVSQHLKPVNRMFHFFGTSIAVLLVGSGLFHEIIWLSGYPWSAVTFGEFIIDLAVMTTDFLLIKVLWGLVCSYYFAWAGHLFFENNYLATFENPFWSLLGDFKMCWLMWWGKMDDEIQKVESAQALAMRANERSSDLYQNRP